MIYSLVVIIAPEAKTIWPPYRKSDRENDLNIFLVRVFNVIMGAIYCIRYVKFVMMQLSQSLDERLCLSCRRREKRQIFNLFQLAKRARSEQYILIRIIFK